MNTCKMNICKKRQAMLLALLAATCGFATVTVAQTPGVEPPASIQNAPRQEATRPATNPLPISSKRATALTAYNVILDATPNR